MDFPDMTNVIMFDPEHQVRRGGSDNGGDANWILKLPKGTRFFYSPSGEAKLIEAIIMEKHGIAVKIYAYAPCGFSRDESEEEVEMELWGWYNSKNFSNQYKLVEIIKGTKNGNSDFFPDGGLDPSS